MTEELRMYASDPRYEYYSELITLNGVLKNPHCWPFNPDNLTEVQRIQVETDFNATLEYVHDILVSDDSEMLRLLEPFMGFALHGWLPSIIHAVDEGEYWNVYDS